MSRGSASTADRELIAHLRDRGVHVSLPQLERWRTAGVLPRNERRALGRGAGSTSLVPPDSVAIAEALARATRPGRPLHEAVLQIFTADPRFALTIFLATPRLSLPENAVREALAWFIRYRENSVQRRIERGVATASTADDAEDVASEIAERHYLGVLRRDRKDLNRSLATEVFPLVGPDEALGYAARAVAAFLGHQAVGSDRLTDAWGSSFGYWSECRADVVKLSQYISAENIKRELSGLPPIGCSSVVHTISGDIDAIRRVDFAAICRARDVLALLAEAAMVYEVMKDRHIGDPIVRRMLDFFTSSLEAHQWVSAAAPLTRTTPAESWRWMASVIVMICSDPDELASFDEVAKGIDFTQDDIRSIFRERSK